LVKNLMDWFNVISGVTKQVDSAIPKEYTLGQNYPNPFNPETSIRISLPKSEMVEIAVFNALGQKIRTLVSQKMAAGSHMAVWDGRNDAGQFVSSGIYFYSLKAGDFAKTKKMVMVK
jgi:flagellar hook assembly protein FlgD